MADFPAPEEVGFVHIVFEEMLAGLHLAGWKLHDQEEFIKRSAGNPRWTTTILAMLHTLTRPSDIDLLLRRMVSSELAAAADVVRRYEDRSVLIGAPFDLPEWMVCFSRYRQQCQIRAAASLRVSQRSRASPFGGNDTRTTPR